MNKQDLKSAKLNTKTPSKENINWKFGSDVKREFSGKWYLGMIIGFLALLSLAVFLIKSWSFVALLVVSVLALVVFIRRPNEAIHYSLTQDGVSIDGTNRPYNGFKAFGVIKNLNGSFKIVLIPTKRLSPALEIDINSEDGEKIVDFLGARLPMKEVELNFIDRIVQRIGL